MEKGDEINVFSLTRKLVDMYMNSSRVYTYRISVKETLAAR